LQKSSLFRPKLFWWGIVLFFILLGTGIRLYDLTDLPNDFHPVRQWRAVLIARGMFYQHMESAPQWQRDLAVAQWQGEGVIEPPVLEWITALVYRVAGQEVLWFPRALSALAWVSAGIAVLLIGRAFGFADGGVIALVYFLFLRYGMFASRTFMPDPLMVALMAWSLWAAVRWQQTRTMTFAGWAGLLAGLAIFVKSVAVFMMGAAFVGLVLAGSGLRRAVRDKQVWAIAILSALPTALYYVYGLFIAGFLNQQLKFRFFPEMWRDPAFYIRWEDMATDTVGVGAFLAAIAGLLLLKKRSQRGLLAGLWLGYAAYSLTFPYHTITHDYYQLPLILIVAVSLIPVLGILANKLADSRWNQIVIAGLLLFGVFFRVWDVRVVLAGKDYRPEAAEWAAYAEYFEPGDKIAAISQTYGYPLRYFAWLDANIWLNDIDLTLRDLAGYDTDAVVDARLEALEGKDYFLVTQMNVLNEQRELKAFLSDFPVIADGDGFVIYDLKPEN